MRKRDYKESDHILYFLHVTLKRKKAYICIFKFLGFTKKVYKVEDGHYMNMILKDFK